MLGILRMIGKGTKRQFMILKADAQACHLGGLLLNGECLVWPIESSHKNGLGRLVRAMSESWLTITGVIFQPPSAHPHCLEHSIKSSAYLADP